MNHKSSNHIKTSLLAAAVLIAAILASGQASAVDFERDFMTSSVNERIPSSARDLLPELETLNCTPQCTGQNPACGEQKTLDGCLSQSAAQGCFWSCD